MESKEESWRVEFFGNELQTHQGIVPTSQVFDGPEFVALLIAASWCPSCSAYMPVFVEFVQALNRLQPLPGHSKILEIVYSSADRDVNSFEGYYHKMEASWCALLFDDKTLRNGNGKAFKVEGIPFIAIFDAKNGKIKMRDSRTPISDLMKRVSADPDSQNVELVNFLQRWRESRGVTADDTRNEDLPTGNLCSCLIL